MPAALRALRADLGNNALILETRSVDSEHGGGVEILAFSDGGMPLSYHTGSLDNRGTDVARNSLITVGGLSDGVAGEKKDDIREELAALRSMLSWLAPGIDSGSGMLKLLIAHGLKPEAIKRVSDVLRSSGSPDDRETTYRILTELIPTGGHIPDAPDRVALVGPTGVGKTSSLIKLSVFEGQRLQRRVGWLSLDQRRIANGDSLPLYASILGVRYETATNPREARRAWERLAGCDLVLVDTPGTPPSNEAALRDLQRMLQALAGVRSILLIAASTNECDMADWVRQYQRLDLSALFFTKLDECRYFGPLINTALEASCPVSYITLGQNIAGDLEVANPDVLTSLLLTRSAG
jgi:flagellar biosynthesis protein FlhF